MKVFAITLFMSILGFTTPTYAETATCNSVVVTADAGTRVIANVDSEPPVEIQAGETKELSFFQMSDSTTTGHRYTINVLDAVTGAQISFTGVDMDGCTTIPFPEPVEPIVMVPGIKAVEPVVTFEPSELFPGLELAYPW